MQRSSRVLSAMAALSGLMILSGVADAQGRGRGGPPGGNPDQPAAAQNGPARPMMAPPRSPAEMLLRQKDRLELTDDQAKRLDALAKAQPDGLKPRRADMLRAQADLAEAEEKDNLDGQRSALEKLSKIRIDEEISRRKAMKDARDVLTPEQRDRLPGLMAGGGRGGMGPGRGMMMRRGAGGMSGGRGGFRRMAPPSGMPGGPTGFRRMAPPSGMPGGPTGFRRMGPPGV